MPKIVANTNSKLEVAHFLCEKTLALDEWMGGWVDVEAGLRIAYSNKKLVSLINFLFNEPIFDLFCPFRNTIDHFGLNSTTTLMKWDSD